METKAPIYITVDERKKVYSTDFSFDPARSRELKLFYNFEQNIMDMTLDEILRLRDMAEHTGVQFKERVTKENKSEVAAEMVAMSNTRGGMVVVGIDDKTGRLNPLSYKEIQEVTALLGNLATDNIIPSILVDIENVQADGGVLVVATIKQGLNKPYHDNNGVVWVKQGADKRKVFDNSELIAMLADNGQMYPDTLPVRGTSIKDLNMEVVKVYLAKRFAPVFSLQNISADELYKMSAEEVAKVIGAEQTVENILKNVGLVLEDGTLTVAAVVLMGEYPQRWLPVFTARCISYIGNSIGGTEFRDKSGSDADGNAVHLYKFIMTFLMRNLRRKQVEADFNSPGELEVSTTTLSEVVVNCILHRSYAADSPLRIFIFDNRIEIHSPGLLPQGITVEDATHGVSVPRNKLLFSNGIHLLPYTGAGSGLTRAQLYTPNIKFENDEGLKEFVVTIWRDSDAESSEVYDRVHDRAYDRVGKDKPLIQNELLGGSAAVEKMDDRASGVVCDRVPYRLLEPIQKNIIQYCSVPRSAREILEHINYKYHPDAIAKMIKPLLSMGYLEFTIPDRPNSPKQKYRKK